MLIDELEARLLWDSDDELGDLFHDRPPVETQADMVLVGIDQDYFVSVRPTT
jgi:hypothetical protein